jgi:hypothetical protein
MRFFQQEKTSKAMKIWRFNGSTTRMRIYEVVYANIYGQLVL